MTSKKDTKRRLFFTSDLWFYRDNIIDIRKRKYKNVSEMNDAYIDKWNMCVGENDVVFVLGNFIYDFSKYEIILGMLRGTKVLLPTDFDKQCIMQNQNLITDILTSETGGLVENFDYVTYKAYNSVGLTTNKEDFEMLKAKIENDEDDFVLLHNNIMEFSDYGIVISHYPLLDWNGKEMGSINIHGGTIQTPTNLKSEKRFNVGVDFCGETPVAYDYIIKIIEKAKQ